ncbi:MAG: hypothetical protein QGH60_15965 [Phycisphaerae bacterium]|nr:hypothetical protein [Phycisphaerae bacterium]
MAPDLPRKRLIADCYAALNPSNALWARYTKEIDKLKESGEVSEDDYIVLRYSTVSKTALMDATCGDPVAFCARTVQEVLKKAKTAVRADLLADIAVKNQQYSDVEQDASTARRDLELYESHARSIGVTIGRCVSLIAQFVLAGILILGAILTLPGVVNKEPTPMVILLVLVILAVASFANLYQGINIKQIGRRLECWVSDKIEAILLKRR